MRILLSLEAMDMTSMYPRMMESMALTMARMIPCLKNLKTAWERISSAMP